MKQVLAHVPRERKANALSLYPDFSVPVLAAVVRALCRPDHLVRNGVRAAPWQRLDTSVSTPLEKTLYANSITLTPGTLTTDVREDHFMIHSLSPEGIEELRKGEMEKRIRRLGV
ncbi:MAG: Na+/H+ antiporter subunit E [Gammaproteobacteria bacterium]